MIGLTSKIKTIEVLLHVMNFQPGDEIIKSLAGDSYSDVKSNPIFADTSLVWTLRF